MLFEKKEVNEIYNVELEKLEDYAKKNGIPFYKEEISSHWNTFAHYRANNIGLCDICCRSFGGLISAMIGGLGYSCGTDIFIREEELENNCIDLYNQIQKEEYSEEDKIRIFFEKVLLIYSEEIEEYTYKNRKVSVMMSEVMFQSFNEIEGKTKSDKFRTLIDFYLKNRD